MSAYVTYIWEGSAALLIAVGTAVASMKTYPDDPWQFVVIIAGGIIAAVKAIDARRRKQPQ